MKEWIIEKYNVCVNFFKDLYAKICSVVNWPYSEYVEFWVVLLVAFLLLVLIIVLLIGLAGKKNKIAFYASGRMIETVKVRYKKPIKFPKAPEKDGYNFIGWCLDLSGTKPYNNLDYDRKEDLNLYAHYQAIPNANLNSQVENISVSDSNLVEYTNEYIYDELRYVMLGFERAFQFKKLGVTRKQIIAEMFEKNGVVNLYLKLDPEFMREKGYNVQTYEDPQFEIVPCKVEVKTKQDFDQAVKLIKETMTVNNLIESGIAFTQKQKSTEAVRKSGFAFFVKNDTVATTAEDYYRYLRAIVVSYKPSKFRKVPDGALNKLILKIYKKAETLFVYLALDPNENGLEDVSFDRSFLDTPAMLEVRSYEDLIRANELIDKLMYRFGMDRNPEKAEISLTDPLDTNCGFGWRVKN